MKRLKSPKSMYDEMINSPARPSMGHTSEKMDVASKMFGGTPKKMATGGFVRSADGCVQRGKTKGRVV